MENIPKDVTLFVLSDGLEIYGQPDKQGRVIVKRIADKARTWNDVWKKDWVIGQSTGETVKGVDGDYVQVLVVQSDWLPSKITTGLFGKLGQYIKADSIGYIPVTVFEKQVYYFSKDGQKINFGDTILGVGGTGTQGNGGGDTTDTTTLILWVMVFVLAMVAGFKALKRKNNG